MKEHNNKQNNQNKLNIHFYYILLIYTSNYIQYKTHFLSTAINGTTITLDTYHKATCCLYWDSLYQRLPVDRGKIFSSRDTLSNLANNKSF